MLALRGPIVKNNICSSLLNDLKRGLISCTTKMRLKLG